MISSSIADLLTGTGRCLLCNSTLLNSIQEPYPICSTCRKSLNTAPGEKRCLKCSIPLISETGLCTRCRDRNFSFGSNNSLFLYSGVIKELLYQYKFMNNKALSFLFAELFFEGYLKTAEPSVLIPVPSAPKNVKKRGWDHMSAISAVLSKKYNQIILDCLARKNSKSQKKLGYNERITNLKGKIVFRGKTRHIPESVLLIDDIFTTGATLEQCAAVLKENGFITVNALTIAID